jgi:hypothetical protein
MTPDNRERALRATASATAYAQQLSIELDARVQDDAELAAEQGFALRTVISHTGEAIVYALLELADATREMVVP